MTRPRRWPAMLAALLAVLLSHPAGAQAQAAADRTLRIGVVHALGGPVSVIAREQSMGIALALDQLGNRIGGDRVMLFEEDGRMTPDAGLQAVTRLIEQDHIDILIGNQLSNQLLAYMPAAEAAHVLVFSDLPGPSELAGAHCTPDLFVMSWENATNSAVIGQAMTNAGVKRAFFIAQNYVTGKEYVAGAKKLYQGAVVGEAYVPIEQTDYAAELAQIRATHPDAVYVFLPGAGGIAFVKQFAASGQARSTHLYSGSWLADEHSFPALGDAALGARVTSNWFADLDNPANRKFVTAFAAKYGRNPVVYAAITYDTIMLLNQAIGALHGDITNHDALRHAVLSAKFSSVRGNFAFNTNQFPIQDYYLAEVVKHDDVVQHHTIGTVLTNVRDAFAPSCAMAP